MRIAQCERWALVSYSHSYTLLFCWGIISLETLKKLAAFKKFLGRRGNNTVENFANTRGEVTLKFEKKKNCRNLWEIKGKLPSTSFGEIVK